MILPNRLRELRGTRKLKDVAAEAGVHYAYLSQLEHGRLLPRDKWIPGIERAYGLESIRQAYPLAVWTFLVPESEAQEAA
jgi:transcriptional regulator with XRE-family HTH domain